ncbi:MAG: PAS domain S-box protein, partial [Anaerolineales bacterium]|nr:PAS domain S-box protein [Anaerolineales bacterium]
MGKTRASNTEAKLEEKNQKNQFPGARLFAAAPDDLLASEEKYRLLAENISDVVWVLDTASQKFKYVSPSMEKLLGYSQEEIMAKSPEELTAPESRDVLTIKLPSRVANFLAGDPSAVTKIDELLQFRKDGSLIWTEIVSTLVQDKDGGLDIVGVSRDISKRKQSEKTLRENEEKYRKLAEELEHRVMERTNEIKSVQRRLEIAAQAAELGIWDWNIITNQLIFDKQMHVIYGTSPETFKGTINDFMRIVHPEDAANLMALAQAVLNGDPHYQVQYRIIREDKSIRHIKAYGTVVSDSNNLPEHVIGVVMDITQDKEAEETLRLANLELERAMRIKDEFLANMSHELRTPLNAILGISESLGEQIAGPINEKQEKYLNIISESGHHLLNLINDILDLSKIEAGRLELNISQFSVEAVCQSSLRMIKELAHRKRLSVSHHLDEKVMTLYADERRLKQMLVNLLSNAVKFSAEGESLGLEVTGNEEENRVTFSVWDTGIGISKKDLPRLFKPFVQLDSRLSREASGTGLGLMLVSQLARLHGGNVTVQSKPGKGSRFTVSLPWYPNKAPKKSAKKDTSSDQAPSTPNRHTRVLLVEDTESVIMHVQDYLEAKGYQVVVARNGYEGIMFAENLLPDIILMDIQIPGMD